MYQGPVTGGGSLCETFMEDRMVPVFCRGSITEGRTGRADQRLQNFPGHLIFLFFKSCENS